MPQCTICKRIGAGVLFPMLPKTEGYRFGDICDKCDDDRSGK